MPTRRSRKNTRGERQLHLRGCVANSKGKDGGGGGERREEGVKSRALLVSDTCPLFL